MTGKAYGILFSAPMLAALDLELKSQTRRLRQPPWKGGDVLYSRENWRTLKEWDAVKPRDLLPVAPWRPEANPGAGASAGEHAEWGRLRPSIHQPRRMSRFTLEVTGVYPEPLQAIGHADARAEGMAWRPGIVSHGWWYVPTLEEETAHADPRESYFRLWDRLNGAGSCAKNPTVWVTKFRAHKGNVDDFLAAKGAK